MVISQSGKKRVKKLALRRQRKVIQLFNNLLASGFHLTEIVDFLERSALLESSYTSHLRQGLLSGQSFALVLGELGFSQDVVTQLSLAEQHGHLERSMTTIQTYLTNVIKIKKKMVAVATYPAILLAFLMLIMLGLRHYLVPQMNDEGVLVQLISHFPTLFLGGCLVGLLLAYGLYLIWKRSSPLAFWCQVAKVPFVGYFVKLYLTAFYAREWGNLIGQGLEMTQIVSLMQAQPSRLFMAVGQDMEQALLSGQEFHDKVSAYPFFLKELGLIIEYGQVKSKLGSELAVYADDIWETFFTKLERASQLIQPLIFMLVAMMIVMVYAAMLLPMYQNMEITL